MSNRDADEAQGIDRLECGTPGHPVHGHESAGGKDPDGSVTPMSGADELNAEVKA